MRLVGSLLAFLWLSVIGCSREPASTTSKPDIPHPSAAAPAVVEAIESPAQRGSAEPFLYGTQDGVLLSWLEPVGDKTHALKFARMQNGRWSSPRTIVQRDDLFVNWADFPSIVEDAKGTLFVHWLQKSGSGTYAYDVRMATSTDGGTTWSEPFLLNRDGMQAEHGFVSLVPLREGGVGATWLDGRNMKAGDHEHDGGDMTVRYATVDAGGNVRGDVEVDERACECCTTGMAMTDAGPVVVYRDRSGEEIRDISFVRQSESGWTRPQQIATDGWKINGCPVNGPQADAFGESVAVAWFTGAGDRQRVYVAWSADSGSTFAAPVIVDDGKPAGRVDVLLLDEGTALIAWLEQTSAGAEIRARRVSRNGRTQPSRKIADSSMARAAGFPRIAKVGRQVYFAWTDQSAASKRIRMARVAL